MSAKGGFYFAQLICAVALAAGCQGGPVGKLLTNQDSAKIARLTDDAGKQYEAGNLDAAAEIYHEILKIDPGNVMANFRMAVLHHKAGRVNDAAAFYQKALKSDPGHFKSNYNLGMIYLNDLKDMDQAEFHLRQAHTSNPLPHVKTELERAIEQAQAKKEAQKPSKVDMPRSLPGGAVSRADSSPAATPGNPKGAEKASKRQPASLPPLAPLPVEGSSSPGQGAGGSPGSTSPEGGVAELKERLKKEPNSPTLLLHLGQAYQRSADNAQAEKSYRKAMEAQPGFIPAYKALADLLEMTGKRKAAIVELKKLTSAQPGEAWAWERLGALALEDGDTATAFSSFTKALQSNPENANVHFRLAQMYDKAMDRQMALEHYKKFSTISDDMDMLKLAGERIKALSGGR